MSTPVRDPTRSRFNSTIGAGTWIPSMSSVGPWGSSPAHRPDPSIVPGNRVPPSSQQSARG